MGTLSVLNPNAPMYVPTAYRAVEDFSDQWWELVQSSPWFRDYWLQECFSDDLLQIHEDDHDTSPPFDDHDLDDDFDDATHAPANKPGGNNKQLEGSMNMELVALGWLKWMRKSRGGSMPRYCSSSSSSFNDKAPKIVNHHQKNARLVCPRPIQQPR